MHNHLFVSNTFDDQIGAPKVVWHRILAPYEHEEEVKQPRARGHLFVHPCNSFRSSNRSQKYFFPVEFKWKMKRECEKIAVLRQQNSILILELSLSYVSDRIDWFLREKTTSIGGVTERIRKKQWGSPFQGGSSRKSSHHSKALNWFARCFNENFYYLHSSPSLWRTTVCFNPV